tara:strand:+ start:902 stop:1063 length:162 start_codon:yes stop_codon:yes gene_type:complete
MKQGQFTSDLRLIRRLSKTVFEVLSSNVVVRLKVFRRWLVDLRRKPSIIQLLD